MATKRKTTTKRKPAAKSAKKAPAKRRANNKTDLDKRWSILLFALGVFFVLLAFIPGESVWATLRVNVLFGGLGISGWLLGPMLIYWAVLVSLGKPVFAPVIKGVLFLIALAGAALVFGKGVYQGMAAAAVMEALLETGKTFFGGGVLSVLLGYTLLALTGRPVANVLVVLFVIIAVMVLTEVTPGDIVRFIKRRWDERPMREEEEWYEEEAEEQPQVAPAPAARRAVAPKGKKRERTGPVDIHLGPEGLPSEPGLAENDEVEIGPGGTFGMNPLHPDDEEILPFDPYSPQSLNGDVPQVESWMFDKDDPRAQQVVQKPTAQANSGLDIPFAPPAEPDFDLFATRGVPPVQVPPAVPPQGFGAVPLQPPTAAAGQNPFASTPRPDASLPFAPDMQAAEKLAGKKLYEQQVGGFVPSGNAGQPDVFGGQASPHSDPSVDAMIDRAAALKEDKSVPGSLCQPPPSVRYNHPPLGLLEPPSPENNEGAREEMKKTADLLVSTLASFGVQTRILDVSRGPSVTRYEVQPQAGVKISRITNLADDIALNLAAAGVRIEAPIPGKPAVGIEVPNRVKSMVSMGGMLEGNSFKGADTPLPIALGKNIAGEVVIADLTKMPHMLIAGSTGSGKSVCVNATIMSFLYKSSPEDVRLLLIDPKVVELAEYNGIPHLLMPVVTEPRKAAGALGSAVAEMERRYHLFAENNVRDIKTFNKRAERNRDLEKMPHIAIVIDELADLMMTSGKEVEDYICRIAQKARAAGMHLIVATQRPSVDVITGLIKANIPSRIAFAVSSQVDSRTILDSGGAEKLLGMGDMLFMPVGANKPVRVQGTYVKDKEISAVLQYIKGQSGSHYDENMMAEMERRAAPEQAEAGENGAESMIQDATFISAVETALENGTISTSFLQRRLRLGYARAGRIMDEMERLNIVSPPDGSKPRDVLINREQWQEMSMNAAD